MQVIFKGRCWVVNVAFVGMVELKVPAHFLHIYCYYYYYYYYYITFTYSATTHIFPLKNKINIYLPPSHRHPSPRIGRKIIRVQLVCIQGFLL